MSKKKPLTGKEKAFVDAYLGRARANGTTAAILAGYAKKSAAVTASRLLRKANIRAVIELREDRRAETSILTSDQRDELLSDVARDLEQDTRERISAIKELNKVTGRHILKHQVEGRVTLEQILGASRAGSSS